MSHSDCGYMDGYFTVSFVVGDDAAVMLLCAARAWLLQYGCCLHSGFVFFYFILCWLGDRNNI